MTLDTQAPANRDEFNEFVFAVVRLIPPGWVMTYGQVAGCIPEPSFIDSLAYRRIRARWVGYALAACPDDVPWQRVINQRGEPSQRQSGGHLAQSALLAAEGTPTRPDGSIDLESAGWTPGELSWDRLLSTGHTSRPQEEGNPP
jgi:methylated-DNA-protein-cysteine methyltransferase-like protein